MILWKWVAAAVVVAMAGGCVARTTAPEAPPEKNQTSADRTSSDRTAALESSAARPPLPPPLPDDPEAAVASGAGWLGVELGAVEPQQPGALVRGVFPTSPAAEAGLVPGDVILRVNGGAVEEPADVGKLIRAQNVGARVNIALRRGDEDRLLAAVLVEKPDEEELVRKVYVDQPAPAFVGLKKAQGSVPVTVGALKGKVVVVEFWAGWCQVCRLVAPRLDEWHTRIEPQGGMVLGITTEPVTQAAREARGLGMSYPILSDESGDTTLAYRAYALPSLFVIDRQGIVRDVMIGYSTEDLERAQALVDELLAG